MSRRFVAQRGPTRVVFGVGSWDEVADEVARLGAERVLLVATPRGAADAAPIATALGERSAGVLAIAAEHVPAEIAARGRAAAGAAGADAVLAVGGGSAIGLGKAIALDGVARLIALPTTYSGSEMTAIYGITEAGAKRTGTDERVRAALVIYDPRATLALPRDTTAASLWNAMAHAVQALWSPGLDPAASADAEEALRLLAGSLPRLWVAPDDLDARTAALEGSYLAGGSLAAAGTGLHHKLVHILGGSFSLPHARTHAALLPRVIAANRDAAPDAIARIGRALGADDGVAAMRALAAAVDAPDLRALGLDPSQLDPVVDAVLASAPRNPRPLERAWLRALLGV